MIMHYEMKMTLKGTAVGYLKFVTRGSLGTMRATHKKESGYAKH
jgi:hypothetical protein